jgi:receptor expression-enhancing protein 5/6
VSLVYPAYASFKAVESPDPDDDKQWLTYWVVIGCYSIADSFLDIFFFWVPFYFVIKLAFVLYLALPHTKGAVYLYDKVVKPFFLKN